MLTLTRIIILSVIQGMAELLPVSSSAHVIAGAKLMGIKDTSTPEFAIMLVMLHTGTMFAVIVYFWNAWKRVFFSSKDAFVRFSTKIIIGTAVTGVVGYPIKLGIEKYLDPGYTTLASQGLCEMGSKPAAPTPSTPLTHVAAIYAPTVRLFNAGDTLTLQGLRDGDVMAPQTAVVAGEDAPKKKGQIRTLKELMAFCQDGLDIDPKAEAPPKAPPPGVTLKPVEGKKDALCIEVVGNTGHENRLKMPETGFTSQKGNSVLFFADTGKAEIEQLFKNLKLIAIALAAAGVLILYSGLNFKAQRYPRKGITTADSVAIGAIQGLCLPFRGFSRSGATISLGLLRGVARFRLEEFSFALAVVLTPIVVIWETMRLIARQDPNAPKIGLHDFVPSLIGMGCSFFAGLIALAVLSKLLEKGQWWLFGVYCLAASCGIYWMSINGY